MPGYLGLRACLDFVRLSGDVANSRNEAFIINALKMHFKANKCMFW